MDLIDKLPSFYDNDITRSIQDSFNLEANTLNEEVETALNEILSVDNSTYYIKYWEKMLGIGNNNLDIQTRQENVKAKMRTRGTSTLKVIKNICEAYSNGEVDIISDNANYSFKVKFVGTLGIPQALEELHKTIEEIKPCHLVHSYEFTYMTWDKFDSYNHIWNEWDTLNLTWNSFETYKEVVV